MSNPLFDKLWGLVTDSPIEECTDDRSGILTCYDIDSMCDGCSHDVDKAYEKLGIILRLDVSEWCITKDITKLVDREVIVELIKRCGKGLEYRYIILRPWIKLDGSLDLIKLAREHSVSFSCHNDWTTTLLTKEDVPILESIVRSELLSSLSLERMFNECWHLSRDLTFLILDTLSSALTVEKYKLVMNRFIVNTMDQDVYGVDLCRAEFSYELVSKLIEDGTIKKKELIYKCLDYGCNDVLTMLIENGMTCEQINLLNIPYCQIKLDMLKLLVESGAQMRAKDGDTVSEKAQYLLNRGFPLELVNQWTTPVTEFGSDSETDYDIDFEGLIYKFIMGHNTNTETTTNTGSSELFGKEVSSGSWYYAGIILIVVAALMFIYALCSNQRISSMSAWPRVTGTITSSAVTTQRGLGNVWDSLWSLFSYSSQVYTPRVTYQYQVGDRTFTSNNFSNGVTTFTLNEAMLLSNQLPVGTVVNVTYNPSRPSEAYLVTTGTPAHGSVLLSIILFILGIVILFKPTLETLAKSGKETGDKSKDLVKENPKLVMSGGYRNTGDYTSYLKNQLRQFTGGARARRY